MISKAVPRKVILKGRMKESAREIEALKIKTGIRAGSVDVVMWDGGGKGSGGDSPPAKG